MSIKSQSKTYIKGLELAEQGHHAESLEYMQRHLEDNPNDAEALSDTGAVLYCLGQTDQAVEHLKKAITADKDYAESYWNLVEVYLNDGQIHHASELYDDMERLGILNSDLTIRTANHFLEQSDKGSAIEMMLKTLEISDCRELIGPMIEVVKSKRPKIAFFGIGPGDAFYGFASERFMTESFLSKQSEELADLINWCDIAWFGSWDETLDRALALPKVCRIVVAADSSDKESKSAESLDKIDKFVDNSQSSDIPFLNGVLLELEKTIDDMQ